MYLAMKAAAEIDMPIVAHVEDNSLLFGGVMNAGKRAEELGLPGILGISESSQTARRPCCTGKRNRRSLSRLSRFDRRKR